MTMGEKMQKLRKQKNWSQETLAEKLGVSRQAVSLWERGESMPEIDKLIPLARLFGVTADYLLDDTQETLGEKPQPTVLPAAGKSPLCAGLSLCHPAGLRGAFVQRAALAAVSDAALAAARAAFTAACPDHSTFSARLCSRTGPHTALAALAAAQPLGAAAHPHPVGQQPALLDAAVFLLGAGAVRRRPHLLPGCRPAQCPTAPLKQKRGVNYPSFFVYLFFSPFSRTSIRIGVPSKPKFSRIWFSRYR